MKTTVVQLCMYSLISTFVVYFNTMFNTLITMKADGTYKRVPEAADVGVSVWFYVVEESAKQPHGWHRESHNKTAQPFLSAKEKRKFIQRETT